MASQKLKAASEIKNMIKDTIRETIQDEFFKMRLELAPEIPDKEMSEIEKKYKSPDKNIVCSERMEV